VCSTGTRFVEASETTFCQPAETYERVATERRRRTVTFVYSHYCTIVAVSATSDTARLSRLLYNPKKKLFCSCSSCVVLAGENAELRYQIVDGDDDGQFTIDKESGVVTVAKSLDRETRPRYDLTVQAVDQAVDPEYRLSSSVVVSRSHHSQTLPRPLPFPNKDEKFSAEFGTQSKQVRELFIHCAPEQKKSA